MKVLITGGSGFIGRNIVKECRKRGWETVSFDSLKKNSDSDYHVIGTVLDFGLLKKSMEDCDAAFHLAAITSPPQFEEPSNSGYEINVMGTYNAIQAACDSGLRKVVIASSSAIYGNITSAVGEESVQENYENMYPITKRINEITAKFFSSRIETVALRYFNTYGIGENSKAQYASVVWRFIRALQSGTDPEIYGDGRQSRDFVYVDDAARASVLALERGKNGEAYNIGTGRSTSFNDIYSMVREEMRSSVLPKYIPNPLKNYQYFTLADMEKTRRDLGFVPDFDLRSGIRKMIQGESKST